VKNELSIKTWFYHPEKRKGTFLSSEGELVIYM
jgi:hypothetical protein